MKHFNYFLFLICFNPWIIALTKSTIPDTPWVMPIHIPGNGFNKIPVANTTINAIIIVQFKMFVFVLLLIKTSFFCSSSCLHQTVQVLTPPRQS